MKSNGGKGKGKVVLAKGSIEITKVEYGKHYTRERMKKVLKPNIEYTSPGGHVYKTDEKGRITSVEGSLDLGSGKRNNYAQRIAGREDRLPDDQGGHLIASIFKGSGHLDNLVPMNANLNMGEWKKLEISWAKALDSNPPKTVEVKIYPVYEGNSTRPTSFDIEYKIDDGRWDLRTFENRAGG
ncbi:MULTISPECIES: DNA/RNA non-specific endonuclease [Peribacillus]|uniref:Ribonuclease YeeF n=1 Tax=Peribacillus simplex TaxID=1478 RepID=A0A9W4LA53_9BACI|nr:DNA/RNA non-specific endonuclease [Peribacillus simplex]MDR4926556.1 DNA/RNA non-specific endonuclease [Peribacillus simplex]CAH0310887.1 Putative ribonuclease YeeF [Peribacillus simplex]